MESFFSTCFQGVMTSYTGVECVVLINAESASRNSCNIIDPNKIKNWLIVQYCWNDYEIYHYRNWYSILEHNTAKQNTI